MELLLRRTAGDFGFETMNETGETIRFDAAASIGGQGYGFRPMESLAASLAACASIDVLLILKKQKIEPSNFEIKIDAKRVDEVPAIFECIQLNFLIESDADQSKIERAINLSLDKYCSVAKILNPTCRITSSLTLFNNQ